MPVGSRLKGNVRFDGLFVVQSAELAWQTHPGTSQRFPNFVFRLRPLPLERQRLDFRWIHSRSEVAREDDEVIHLAPEAWRRWIESGHQGSEAGWP